MMKKILLLAVASLMVTTASAQKLMRAQKVVKQPNLSEQKITRADIPTRVMTKQDRDLNAPVVRAPKKAANKMDIWYRRPAGAFSGIFRSEDGFMSNSQFYAPYYHLKPYCDYTFKGTDETGVSGSHYFYEYQTWGFDEETQQSGYVWGLADNTLDFTYQYGYELPDVPIIYKEGPGDYFSLFTVVGQEMEGDINEAHPVENAEQYSANIASIPSFYDLWGWDLMKSSRTLTTGGMNADVYVPLITYIGMIPTEEQIDYQFEYEDVSSEADVSGYWWGKNSGYRPVRLSADSEERDTVIWLMDGIAQAFEKPQNPYLLKNVCIWASHMGIKSEFEMTCKVYKLDSIPAFTEDGGYNILPEEPGELVVVGKATVDSTYDETNNGLITFTLYVEEGGMEIQYQPTIDYPILVTFEGFNNFDGKHPEMDNLVDFSATSAFDEEFDEGFGELAYVRFGGRYDRDTDDEDIFEGGTFNGHNYKGEFVWRGLENMWPGTYSGFSIFLATDMPFMRYVVRSGESSFYLLDNEYCEYTFPNEGGLMVKEFQMDEETTLTATSIDFYSSTGSADDGWYLTCNGSDELPDWLEIVLEDEMEVDEETGEDLFSGFTNAKVTAQPLPEGVPYREAVIRFEFPGAYIDYTFTQGEKQPDLLGDVNGDGEVGLADMNVLLQIVLDGGCDDADMLKRADVNQDGEVGLADMNVLLELVLNEA